jgi:hypothetical protein
LVTTPAQAQATYDSIPTPENGELAYKMAFGWAVHKVTDDVDMITSSLQRLIDILEEPGQQHPLEEESETD